MRMERVVDALTRPRRGRRPLMLLLLAEELEPWIRAFNVFSLHHAARGARDDDGARDLVPRRAADDRVARPDEDRPVGARRRPADAPREGRHADDGRRADPRVDRRHDAAVGQPRQPLRLGRAAGDAGLRRRRLGRRLAQGRLPQSEGAVGAREAPLAVADRARRRDLPRVLGLRAGQHAVRPAAVRVGAERLQRRPVAEGRPDRAVLQVDLVPAGRLGLHRAHVLRDRRHEQRRQPDRRPRRPRDHADGDGRRARSASSRT